MTKMIIAIVIGAALGYGYYRFVGCSIGTCPITGDPFISTIFGAILGALIVGIPHS